MPGRDGADAHGYGQDPPAGSSGTRRAGGRRGPGLRVDCGPPSGAGGTDRGNGGTLRAGPDGRACARLLHPMAVEALGGCG